MTASNVNEEVLQLFKQRLALGRLAHAYLFIAPLQGGQRETALAIAALVNCEQTASAPCGSCPSCQKIQHGHHPDIYQQAMDDESIKIDQIRQWLNRSQLRAYEARYKVFIIPECQRMTPEAANAFLKTLEEPSAMSLIILTTHVPHLVLDTVKSRCQWIRFKPQGVAALQSDLIEQGMEIPQARFLSRYAQGWPLVAKHLWQNGFERKEQEIMSRVFDGPISDDTIKEFVEDDELANHVLELILLAVRDAWVFRATGQRQWVNLDGHMAVIERLSEKPPSELTAIVLQIKQIKNQMSENLNAKMAWLILKERLWNPLSKLN